jgi:hypothetical protein
VPEHDPVLGRAASRRAAVRLEHLAASPEHETGNQQGSDSMLFKKDGRQEIQTEVTRPQPARPTTSASSVGATNEIIRAQGVVKTYDTGSSKLTVLKGLDFSVRRGERR